MIILEELVYEKYYQDLYMTTLMFYMQGHFRAKQHLSWFLYLRYTIQSNKERFTL